MTVRVEVTTQRNSLNAFSHVLALCLHVRQEVPSTMLQTQIKEEEVDSKKYFAAQVSAYPAVLERSPRVGVFFTWEEVSLLYLLT